MMETLDTLHEAVLRAAITGLKVVPGTQKTLAPWLFYDDLGSQLFEQITALPEYYLTRAERAIFATHGDAIVAEMKGPVTFAELGAGTAAKTGLLLQAALRLQPEVLYQPIDVSGSALEEAARNIATHFPGVTVEPQVANYITEAFSLKRPSQQRVLALYIGSSVGNFSPEEASGILRNLRQHLEPGDALLLGTDLAPDRETGGSKTVATLLAAYDDADGITAAFNKNILTRLNRELDADFEVDCFAHRARWNAGESRIEMHLESAAAQSVHVAGQRIRFAAGETIHTENSYKFTEDAVSTLLAGADFAPARSWRDAAGSFAVTLARAVESQPIEDAAA